MEQCRCTNISQDYFGQAEKISQSYESKNLLLVEVGNTCSL